MTTYREIVYMILDLIKLNSDDAYYTEDHIIYLLDKYRAYILKSKYDKDPTGELSDTNYQTITMALEPYEDYVRTVNGFPEPSSIGKLRAFSGDMLKDEITLVSPERFRYVGLNRYLYHIIYGTMGPDDKLYLKSSNGQFKYLDNITVRGIFESPSEALKEANKDNSDFDILDEIFPLEENLIPLLIDYIVRELNPAAYNPEDNKNNAKDDLAGLTVKNVNYGKRPKGLEEQ